MKQIWENVKKLLNLYDVSMGVHSIILPSFMNTTIFHNEKI